MSAVITEGLHECAAGLDQRPAVDVAALLVAGQVEAAKSVQKVATSMAKAAARMAQTIRHQGRIHYIAAGSSGLMAAADAQELGGTFSIPAEQLRIHMAGGLPTGLDMPGSTEDEADSLSAALSDLTATDTVIAVSASGSTPYTVTAAEISKARGATLIAIANNADAVLLRMADHAIHLETPPEVLSGSTRLGAGTAQKIALNTLSTMMAVELGHVHDGMMVNLQADNEKLRARANGIVQQIACVSEASAQRALAAADGQVKAAILMAARGFSYEQAVTQLASTNGHLRPALGPTHQ